MSLISPNKLYVDLSKKCHGYGVFAAEDISKDEIIEQAVTQAVDLKCTKKESKSFRRYLYSPPASVGCACNAMDENNNPVCLYYVMSTGYIQIYNHSFSPDVIFEWDVGKRIISVKALNNIIHGDEVFTKYGGKYDNFNPVPLSYCK